MAVVGAGPVGLGLALHAALLLPHAQITLFDARPLDQDVARDPRTLALALGSIQFLQRLAAWPDAAAEAIHEVHVSQAAPSWRGAEVTLRASELGVPRLGAVLSYGALVQAMQTRWLSLAQAQPQRLRTSFGTAVTALDNAGGDTSGGTSHHTPCGTSHHTPCGTSHDTPRGTSHHTPCGTSHHTPCGTSHDTPRGVVLDAGIHESFDLAVIAEGGVFAEQSRKTLSRDYGQTAWVGTVTREGAAPGLAIERFTRAGPLALLPLRATTEGLQRAAVIWCVGSDEDPVRNLDDAQRLVLMQTLLPAPAGRLLSASALKPFALGLNAQRSLVRGRTVRIGNAAQTLHPVAGQGLNLGLRDAAALVAQLRFADDLDAALSRVEWARGLDRWSTIAGTDFLARSFTWRAPLVALARGAALAALQAAGPTKGWLARQMMFGVR